MEWHAQFSEILWKTVFCDFFNGTKACGAINRELISVTTQWDFRTDCDEKV